MAKKLDLKKVFLERGEKIGLGLAVVIGLALLVKSLFLPGRGLLGPAAAEKVKALKGPADTAERKLRDPENKPSRPDEIAPSGKEAQAKLIKPDLDPLASADFHHAPYGHDVGGQGLVRSMPQVFTIEEAVAEAAAVPLQSYILEVVRGQLYVSVLATDGEGGGGGEKGPGEAIGKSNKRMMDMMLGKAKGPGGKGAGGMPFMPGPGAGASGAGPRMNLGMPGLVQQQGEAKRKAKKVKQVKVDELKSGDVMAEQVRPTRMAVIAASFPYKKQVEEFKTKLRKASPEDVLAENSAEPGPSGQAQASFRFLEVKVQRREVDADGKTTAWADLKLGDTYKPYVVYTGKRVEEDDPKYDAVKFPGLVMPKLMQFRPENVGKGVTGTRYGGMAMYGGMGDPRMSGEGPAPMPLDKGKGKGKSKGKDKDKDQDQDDDEEKVIDRYPKVEEQLALLKATLKDLEGKTATDVIQPNRTFSADKFDLFGTRSDEGDQKTGEGGEAKPGEGEEGQPELTKPRELPTHCLVRVIDVTVEPGKTYEYRLKIVMANPNRKRKDVASTDYQKAQTLESDWSSIPIKVSVQEDLRYYAVDQKKLETKYAGLNRDLSVSEDRQVVLQAHRYLNTVSLGTKTEVLVGEWAVAERFAVYRGEYVGRTERVEVPVWQFDIEDFVVASDSKAKGSRPSIEVHFGYGARGEQPEAILVDFDTGKHNYERVVSATEEKVETRKVTDQAHVEVLMLNPDGKLILREGAIDCAQEGKNDGKDDKQLSEGERRWEEVRKARKRVRGLKKDSKKKDTIDRGTGPGESGS
jgi:hypothetical protein